MTAPNLDTLKFYIVVPAAATNYVTNPTPYRSTTGYTVHDGGSGATIAGSDTEQRRGPKCIKITPPAADELAGVYFSPISVTDTHTYTFSCDVKGVVGQAMRIYITKAAGAALATTIFTATGYWQRVEVTLTATETDSTYRLYVDRDAVNSESV